MLPQSPLSLLTTCHISKLVLICVMLLVKLLSLWLASEGYTSMRGQRYCFMRCVLMAFICSTSIAKSIGNLPFNTEPRGVVFMTSSGFIFHEYSTRRQRTSSFLEAPHLNLATPHIFSCLCADEALTMLISRFVM